jgi:hypothetical protein
LVPRHADSEESAEADKQANNVTQNLEAAVKYEPNIMNFTSMRQFPKRLDQKGAKNRSRSIAMEESPTYSNARMEFVKDRKKKGKGS